MEFHAATPQSAVTVARSTPTPRDENWPAHGNGKPACVLIVDDDPATRMLCSINLQREGLLVLEAADGRLGLARARVERPDLVLTDVMMPRLDGFQLAEALRRDERTCQIPLVFLSGETPADHEARARELGAVAYVTKPFDPPALTSLVVRVLARNGAVAASHPAA
jgi:two-component system chemotaxis response regulator CheY